MGGVAVAILSFGLLRTIHHAWYAGVEASNQNRLVTRSAISLVFPLPLAYRDRISAIPGVTAVSYGNWFGGVYKDRKNFIAQFAVDPTTYFDLYREFVVTPDQRAAFLRDRNACIVGRKLAARFGWKIGDVVPITGTIYPGEWNFVIRGIYRGEKPSTDETQLFFRWDYLDERLRQIEPDRAGSVGFYMIRIADADEAAEISKKVDERFKNSLAETLTETEKAFQMGFVAMTSAIVSAIRIVSYLIVGIILIVLANTMAMTARERLGEYVVMKTLGFRGGHLAALIGGEAVALAALGGSTGLLLLFPAARLFARAVSGFFPVFEVEAATVFIGATAVIVVGFLAAIVPVWRALHIRIAEGLRHLG